MQKISVMLLPLVNTLLKADARRTNDLHLLKIQDRNRLKWEKKQERCRKAAERLTQPERHPSVAQRRRALRMIDHVSETASTEGETDFDPREDGDAYLNDIEYLEGDPAAQRRNIASTSRATIHSDTADSSQMNPPKRTRMSAPTTRPPSSRINARKFAASKKKALKIPH